MLNAITISSGEDSDIEYIQTNTNSRGGVHDYVNNGGVQLLGVVHNPIGANNVGENTRQGPRITQPQLNQQFYPQDVPINSFTSSQHDNQTNMQMGLPQVIAPPQSSNLCNYGYNNPSKSDDKEFDTDSYEEFYTGDELYSDGDDYLGLNTKGNGIREHIQENINTAIGARSIRGKGRGRVASRRRRGAGRGTTATRGRGRGRGKVTEKPAKAIKRNKKTISNVFNDLGLKESDSENEKSEGDLEQTGSVNFNANGLIDDHFSSSEDEELEKPKKKPTINKQVLTSIGTSKSNTNSNRFDNADIVDREILHLKRYGSQESKTIHPSNDPEKIDNNCQIYISNSQHSDYLEDGNIFEKFLENDSSVIGLNEDVIDQPGPQEESNTENNPTAGNFEDFFLSSKALKRKETDSESDAGLPEIQLSLELNSHKMKKMSPIIQPQKSTQDSKSSKIDDIEKYIEDGLRELEEEDLLEQEKLKENSQDIDDDIILTVSRSPSLSPSPEFLYSPPVQIIESQASPRRYNNDGIKELDNLEKTMKSDSLKDLDPELLAIQERVRSQSSEATTTDIKSSKKRKGTKLQISCNMYREPNGLDHFGDEFYEPIHFVIYEKDTFNRIIDEISEIKHIPKQLLVITYKNSQLFSLATPSSVGMNQPLNEVLVYIKGTYDKLNNEKRLQLSELLTRETQSDTLNSAVDLTNEDENSPISQKHQTKFQKVSSDAPDDEFSDLFKPTEFFGIKLRNKSGKDSLFKVHSGTKLSSLVEAYIQKNELGIDPALVKLKFDGDPIELDQTVGDTEVEDGDLLDIFY